MGNRPLFYDLTKLSTSLGHQEHRLSAEKSLQILSREPYVVSGDNLTRHLGFIFPTVVYLFEFFPTKTVSEFISTFKFCLFQNLTRCKA